MWSFLKVFILCAIVVNANGSPATYPTRCPKQCICNPEESSATCTSLNDLTKFGMELFTLTIKNPIKELQLNYEIFKGLGLESLHQLIIDNATITNIDQFTFNGIQLQHLVITNSKIPEIPQETFAPLTNLLTINLTNSTLNNIDIVSETVNEIKLSGCKIKKLPINVFAQCPKLTYVNLENNELTTFVGYKFLSVVEELYLGNNQIKDFNFEYINDFSTNGLCKLDLSHNPIETINVNKAINIYLEVFICNHCNLKNISFIKELDTIMTMEFEHNKITEIETDTFNMLSELEILNLAHNQLTTLPKELFLYNIHLTTLTLDGNKFTKLPVFQAKDIHYKFSMNILSCNNCQIEELDEDTFKQMPSLTMLDLKNNHIKVLPTHIFRKAQSLRRLDLTNNTLNTIDKEVFASNNNLEVLNLSGNKFQTLHAEWFKNNHNLKQLDVSNCQLNDLWALPRTTRLPTLSYLNIANNKLEVITVDELEVTGKLKSLNLAGNELICNSVVSDMKNWLIKKRVIPIMIKTNEKLAMNSDIKHSPWEYICMDDNDNTYHDDYDYSWKAEISDDDNKTFFVDEEEIDESSLEADKINIDIGVLIKDPSKPVYNKYIDNSDDEITYTEIVNTDEELNQFVQDVEDVIEVQESKFNKEDERKIVVFLIPTLVFLVTALIVLIFTVTAILYILRKRNNKISANHPQITIIPWKNGKLKKHSGSIYRPLSEEIIPKFTTSQTPLVR